MKGLKLCALQILPHSKPYNSSSRNIVVDRPRHDAMKTIKEKNETIKRKVAERYNSLGLGRHAG